MDRAPSNSHSRPYAFVCYSHDDTQIVSQDLDWLRSQGINVWFDTGISAGAVWKDEIAGAIDGAGLVLFFATPSSTASSHCSREISYAADQDVPLLAVNVQPVELPRAMRLVILDRQTISRYSLSKLDYQRVLLGAINRALSTSSTQLDGSDVPRDDRIRLGVRSASKELASAIARYLSWQGGVFRAHQLDIDVSEARARMVVEYRIDVDTRVDNDTTTTSWEVSTTDTHELIWASSLEEHSALIVRKLPRIAETIGEGALKTISEHEIDRIARRPIETLGYSHLLLIGEQLNYLDQERISTRVAALERAIDLEPQTGYAHASLAGLMSWRLINGVGAGDGRDKTDLIQEVRLGLRYAPNDPFVLRSVGSTYCRLGRHEVGLDLLRRSHAMAPTVEAKDQLARSLCIAGLPNEAIPLFEEILHTMPSGHTFPYVRLVVAFTQAGRLEEALKFSKSSITHFPEDYFGWLMHANLLALRDAENEGREALDEAIRLVPKLDLASTVTRIERTYVRPVGENWLTAGLRKIAPQQ